MRNVHRLPFSPDYDFVAARALLLDGESLGAGDRVPKERLQPRLLRKLFEQRKIRPLIEGEDIPVKERAPAPPTGDTPGQSAGAAGGADSPTAAPVPPTPDELHIKSQGFGRWAVMRGADVLHGSLKKEEAEQKLSELKG